MKDEIDIISMKVCPKCKIRKNIKNEFHKNKSRPDGHQNLCKKCRNKYTSKWQKQNYIKLKPKKRLDKLNLKQRNKQYILDYLKSNPCVDCGESDPVVLEFDHVRGDKLHNLVKMISNGMSIRRLEIEIEKCEIRCANCHRIKTVKEVNSYRNYMKPNIPR